jgi:molybdopterin-containing oxidoreductase family molybdopterin binding subunit
MKHNLWESFWRAYGPTNRVNAGAALHCGDAAHHVTRDFYASWDAGPDWKYAKYVMFFGASQGFGSGHASTINMRMAADARERGIKFVVFDPMCNNTGDKSTEWIPIIPGADSAVVLAMINVILNDLNIYDESYIKYKTNGPYLIGPDGLYIRNEDSGKPLVWDTIDNIAKEFNDPSIMEYALNGEYEVYGIKCQPAFQLIKDHVKQYTPELAQLASTVPANTIRRIAREFAEAAHIGSTIMIDGVELPYRPVSAAIFRGGQGHTNGMHQCYSIHILNSILGATDVPGGTVALGPSRVLGDPNTGKPSVEPYADPDGLLHPGLWVGPGVSKAENYEPHALPSLPALGTGLNNLFTMGMSSCFTTSKDRHELWEKLGIDYRIEMLFSWANNSVMGQGNPQTHAEALMEIPFIVCYELFPTELSEGFADIVLPGCSKLEHPTSCADAYDFFFNMPIASEDFSIHITQPVIEPQHQRKFVVDFLFELADKLEMRDAFNDQLNRRFSLDGKYKIKPGEKLNLEQISDRVFRCNHGDDHGIDWFKEHGFIRWKKKPQEAYWRWDIDARVPIYLHDLQLHGPKIKELAEGAGVHAQWEQYTGLISWFPPVTHKVSGEYDLYCYSYRVTLHSGGQTMENPWLDEASKMNPHIYNIVLNSQTARAKGLQDGDIIWVESNYGRRTKGPVKTTECVHPQCVGIAATAGHWVKGQPIAYGKGVHFNELMELDLEHTDPVSMSIETSARVKIYKA